MKLESLQDLLVEQMQDLYSAESQLIEALPKMAKTAHTPALKQAFTSHLEETRGHAKRLEDIFQTLKKSPAGKKCQAMAGLIKEGDEMIKEDATPDVKDAGLIAAAQRIEHYEMAGYGTVRTFTQSLGMKDAMRLLDQTLKEEKAADDKLTTIAEENVNPKAQAAN